MRVVDPDPKNKQVYTDEFIDHIKKNLEKRL